MKKVLIVIDNLECGGAQKSLCTLLKHIDYSKFDIELLVLFLRGEFIKDISSRVRVHTLFDFTGKDTWLKKIMNKVFIRIWSTALKYSKGLFVNKRINYEGFEYIIAFLEGQSTNYVSKLQVTGGQKISWVRTDLYTFPWIKKVYRNYSDEIRSYKSFNKIVFVTENAKNSFIKRYGPSFNNLIVINNAIDIEQVISLAKVQDLSLYKINLCSVGSLFTVKGYDRLIKTHKRLLETGFYHHLVIIGEGRERRKLEKLIKGLKVTNSVKLEGYKRNPYPWIRKCDIFVSASLAEGFSLVLAEALVLNKPIVATETDGSREVLGAGKYGMIVSNNEEGLYHGLKEMIKCRTLRDSYSAKTRERAEFLSTRRLLQQFEELLN